jgi:hypothetical protein
MDYFTQIQSELEVTFPLVFTPDNKLIHLLKGQQARVRKIDDLYGRGGVPSKI